MALVKCKECKKEVSDNADTCPHCGIKNPGITKKDSLIGCAGFIVICLAVGFWLFSDDESDKIEIANKTLANYRQESISDRQKIVSNFVSQKKIDKSHTNAFYNCLSQMSYRKSHDTKVDEALGWCQVNFTKNPKTFNVMSILIPSCLGLVAGMALIVH